MTSSPPKSRETAISPGAPSFQAARLRLGGLGFGFRVSGLGFGFRV